MNINQLFEQLVGVGNAPTAQDQAQPAQQAEASGVSALLGNFPGGAAGGLAGGLAAGGLLGALVGNKKMRKKAKKMAGGALGYGGSAVLGALALKAYQNWQSGMDAPAPTQGHGQQVQLATPESFDPALNEDASGQPMQLALVKAMIAAANADGHIDQDEQAAVFDAVDRLALDAEAKAVVFDVLRNPPTVAQIAAYANGLEQASEIYLASRLAIDPDHPAERKYLSDLAQAMSLPAGLVQEIEAQFDPEAAARS
ncbi:MAG: tellurite resistance TerB family protein [Pseudomonadota bacterium]